MTQLQFCSFHHAFTDRHAKLQLKYGEVTAELAPALSKAASNQLEQSKTPTAKLKLRPRTTRQQHQLGSHPHHEPTAVW
jgi:hypothetical protein